MKIKAPKKQTALSNKPSVALRQALEDLKWVERSKRFSVYMHQWVFGDQNTCQVCLAGSTLIRRTKFAQKEIDAAMGEGGVSHEWEKALLTRSKMYALNEVREADWVAFMRFWPYYKKQMERALPELPELPAYEEDPKAFKSGLRKAAKVFERCGC